MNLIDGMCPLCYRPVAGWAHVVIEGEDQRLAVCKDALLGPEFPRDSETGEPLLLQLPYRGDAWLFGAACIHLMQVKRALAEPAFDVFCERWPIGAALDMEPDPEYALMEHYRPLGLHQMRAACTRAIQASGIAGYTRYTREAAFVLYGLDLERPATDRAVEAWRRWRRWQDGMEP